MTRSRDMMPVLLQRPHAKTIDEAARSDCLVAFFGSLKGLVQSAQGKRALSRELFPSVLHTCFLEHTTWN